MHRIDNATAAALLPSPGPAGTPGYWTKGDPLGGQPATIMDQDWFNAVQEELIHVLTAAGVVPAKGTSTQLLQTLRRAASLNIRSITATTMLTADDAGIVLVSAAGGAVNLTLPAVNAAGGAPLRFTFVRTDSATANAVTIQRAGSDEIEGGATLPIDPRGRITLVSDGVGQWRLASSLGVGGAALFSAPGTTNFVVPAGVFLVRVRVTGGGGGGGGANASSAGGGGAGGSTAFGVFRVQPGQTIPVTVGAGGSGGTVAGNGAAGGTSSFGALMSAPGGNPGQGVASGFGVAGVGVTPAGGYANWPGVPGGGGIQFGTTFVGGAGGAGAFSASPSLLSTTVGSTGGAPGGGGGGGANGNAGGSGAAGMVEVNW